MTKSQIAYIKDIKEDVQAKLKTILMQKDAVQHLWEILEKATKKNKEITKENEDLKNRLNQLQEDFEWSQKRIDSQKRRIERLKKGEDRNQEFRTDY